MVPLELSKRVLIGEVLLTKKSSPLLSRTAVQTGYVISSPLHSIQGCMRVGVGCLGGLPTGFSAPRCLPLQCNFHRAEDGEAMKRRDASLTCH